MGKKRTPLVLRGVRKLYCDNPDCDYRKKKGWSFGTARSVDDQPPFPCRHCGEPLTQKAHMHDSD